MDKILLYKNQDVKLYVSHTENTSKQVIQILRAKPLAARMISAAISIVAALPYILNKEEVKLLIKDDGAPIKNIFIISGKNGRIRATIDNEWVTTPLDNRGYNTLNLAKIFNNGTITIMVDDLKGYTSKIVEGNISLSISVAIAKHFGNKIAMLTSSYINEKKEPTTSSTTFLLAKNNIENNEVNVKINKIIGSLAKKTKTIESVLKDFTLIEKHNMRWWCKDKKYIVGKQCLFCRKMAEEHATK